MANLFEGEESHGTVCLIATGDDNRKAARFGGIRRIARFSSVDS